MFTKRKAFAQYRKFNKQFIESFVGELKQAGLTDIEIKLPKNLIEDGKDVIKINEFLNRGRNYPALILIARNKSKSEELKALFINISSKTKFIDDTFPSGHSEPPELFVQTQDPVRTHGLFGYFYEYLVTKSLGPNILLWVLSLSFFAIFLLEVKWFSQTRMLFLANIFRWSSVTDILLILMGFVIIFQFFSQDSGLFVKEREIRWLSLIRRLLKGEYKDNPFVNLIAAIIGTVLAALILKLFGI